MKKVRFTLIGVCLMIGLICATSQADAITYNYNYILAGPGGLPTSIGTLTLTDNGNLVDFNLTLANSSWKALELTLNFDDSKFSNSSALGLLSGTLKVAKNATKADGYPGMFDIQIPSNGSIGTFGGYSGSISLNGGASNLDVSDFNFTDTSGALYSAVHVGNLTNGNSVWVGGTSSVPEPGTLVLLGLGLVGIFGFRKKLAIVSVRA